MNFAELSLRYRGAAAKAYERQRATGMKWMREQEALALLLSKIPAGDSVIDVPVGTGRFLELYKAFGLVATGVDISDEMLAEAKRRATQLDAPVQLVAGDIRNLAWQSGSFDVAVCIRFLNWIDAQDVDAVFAELTRISRRGLIVGIRQYLTRDELRPSSLAGLGRWILQQGWRSSSLLGRELIVHEPATILRLFLKHRLQVVSRRNIDEKRYGTVYSIYLLEKSPGT